MTATVTGMRDEAAGKALDAIATACGCSDWEYPGQVVRDVEAVVSEVERFAREVEALRAAMREALAPECPDPCYVLTHALETVRRAQ